MDFAIPTDNRVKIKESKNGNKYLDLARELRKLRNMRVTDGDATCNWNTWNNPPMFLKEVTRVGNQRTNRDHIDNSILEICQNPEKSTGNLRRLAVTQTPVKDHQQTLK